MQGLQLLHVHIAVCVYVHYVVLQSGLWGAPPNWSRELVTYTCPSGYCDCSQSFDGEENIGCLLNYTDPNGICTEGRTGTCIDGRICALQLIM